MNSPLQNGLVLIQSSQPNICSLVYQMQKKKAMLTPWANSIYNSISNQVNTSPFLVVHLLLHIIQNNQKTFLLTVLIYHLLVITPLTCGIKMLKAGLAGT